jgi:hypothetical protein
MRRDSRSARPSAASARSAKTRRSGSATGDVAA